LFNHFMSSPPSPIPAPADSDYRLAPDLAARLIGGLLLLLAVVMVGATLLVALLGLSLWVLVVVVVLGLVGVFGAAAVLTRSLAVVHLGSSGYRIRLVRGVGVTAAGWREVDEAVTTTTPTGLPVVVLKLVDGRTTTIPVTILAADREEFARDLRAHLQHGQGLRPLS
jgi:hypothetical protein